MLIVAVIKLNGDNPYPVLSMRCFNFIEERGLENVRTCPAANNLKLLRTSVFASCQIAMREYLTLPVQGGGGGVG